jgi:DNA-binding Lrp family transcriptional regulator
MPLTPKEASNLNPKVTKTPIKEFQIVTKPKQIKLLLDGITKEIVFKYLVNEPMTVSQIADAMKQSPGKILYYLQKLKKEQLIELVETRETPKGIVERYYRAVAKEFRLGISERISTYSEVPISSRDRVMAAILGLSTLGINFVESDKEYARSLLQRLVDRETEISRVYDSKSNHAFQSLPPATHNDVSYRMSQFLLSQDANYKRTLSEWHDLIAKYLRKIEVDGA